jgi:hypothetical protein
MERSTDRILTTHTGSLPRLDDLVDLLYVHRQRWRDEQGLILHLRQRAPDRFRDQIGLYTGLRSTVSLRHALLGVLKDQPLTGYDLVRHFQGDDIEARRASSEQPVLASG